MGFLQYFEIVRNWILDVDSFDKNLNCVRLEWSRTGSEKDSLSEKCFLLCPVDSICGSVQLLRAYNAHELLDASVLEKQEQFSSFGDKHAKK